MTSLCLRQIQPKGWFAIYTFMIYSEEDEKDIPSSRTQMSCLSKVMRSLKYITVERVCYRLIDILYSRLWILKFSFSILILDLSFRRLASFLCRLDTSEQIS